MVVILVDLGLQLVRLVDTLIIYLCIISLNEPKSTEWFRLGDLLPFPT